VVIPPTTWKNVGGCALGTNGHVLRQWEEVVCKVNVQKYWTLLSVTLCVVEDGVESTFAIQQSRETFLVRSPDLLNNSRDGGSEKLRSTF
jgi:hypothetical protein